MLYLLPEVLFGFLYLITLRIAGYLCQDEINLLHLQIHDVVHDALCQLSVTAELLEVESGLGSERMLYVAVEVEAEQTAAIVGAERYLAAGVGAHSAEAQVGIAVGDALTQYGVPEQHAGLSALPCVVHYLLPYLAGRQLLLVHRLLAVYGELLYKRLVVDGRVHKLIGYFYRHVGTRYLALRHLGVDEGLAVGVLDAHREHEGTAPAVLRHLAC